MEVTITISKVHNISPFDILNQDMEDVIMLINYYISKGEETKPKSNIKRVMVDDTTATGGWY